MKSLLHKIQRRCFKVLHANPFRKEYLHRNNLFRDMNKQFVLRNYPDSLFVASEEAVENYNEFINWFRVRLPSLQEKGFCSQL